MRERSHICKEGLLVSLLHPHDYDFRLGIPVYQLTQLGTHSINVWFSSLHFARNLQIDANSVLPQNVPLIFGRLKFLNLKNKTSGLGETVSVYKVLAGPA